MQNKDVAIHFTKIARDRFQIYDFRDKSNKIANTRDLASYLANLRGGQALDNSFYSKLISMPNFSTIAISEDALKINKLASTTKLEPWKLEKTADGEVFVSAIDTEEEEEDIKKCASLNVKHHYIISINAKDEDQKIKTYASIKKSACVPETCIEISPVNDCVNFDYESEKAPFAVIEEIVALLSALGLTIVPAQVSCCHDFCDCGMDHVGPVVPCEENEYILDCYEENPIVGTSVDSLKSFAEAHNKKHFKIYAFDRVVFDSDATIQVKAEDNNKSIFTLYLYSDTDNLEEQRDYHSFKEASDAFLPLQKEFAERKENPVAINYLKIKEYTNNKEEVVKAWEGTDTGSLIPSDVSAEEVVAAPAKEEVEVKETETNEPQPLPTSEKKEVEEKVETPEGQKLEEKVEETVEASAEEVIEKKAEDTNTEYHVELYTKLDADENPEGFDAERYNHNYFKTLEEAKAWAEKLTNKKNHYYEISLNDEVVETSENDINKKAESDEHMIEDIFLWTTNTGSIYNFTIQPIIKALAKHKVKGDYTDERALDAWMYAVIAGMKDYAKQMTPGANWYDLLTVVDRQEVAKRLAEYYLEDVEEKVEDLSSTSMKDTATLEQASVKKEAEINADLDVVVDKLEKGDLLKGTAEREEAVKKLVKDKNKKEEVKKLKDEDILTETEIKEAKEDGIEKESKVVKQDGKYQAQSEKGKNFGTYDTKQEAEDRVKQMEMFKHMDKKSADTNKNFTETFENAITDIEIEKDNRKQAHDDIVSSLNDLKLILEGQDKQGDYAETARDAAEVFSLYAKKGQTYKDFVAEYIDIDDSNKEAIERVDTYIKENNITPKASENTSLAKEAEKGTVLVDKNTNEVIKPGESTEGKELKQVEVDNVEKTANNAVYNLFMKSAKIQVNKAELRVLTAAYNSALFKKVAYFGPTSFAFADKHATFIVENDTATCHKTADLTEVEIEESAKEDPKAANEKEFSDFLNELNKEVK